MLVGDVRDRTAILIDDLADTSNTITRAAKLLKKEGASTVYALVTHGILSGDAIERINASALDKVVVTNTIEQEEHLKRCPKLEVLEVGHVFAEVNNAHTTPFTRSLSLLTKSRRPSVASTTAKASVFYSNMIEDISPSIAFCFYFILIVFHFAFKKKFPPWLALWHYPRETDMFAMNNKPVEDIARRGIYLDMFSKFCLYFHRQTQGNERLVQIQFNSTTN